MLNTFQMRQSYGFKQSFCYRSRLHSLCLYFLLPKKLNRWFDFTQNDCCSYHGEVITFKNTYFFVAITIRRPFSVLN